jgi:demethylmenaquinone methyltransferase/2-methoxy-6-polyprenyl-1,4-benzoquinol methylase
VTLRFLRDLGALCAEYFALSARDAQRSRRETIMHTPDKAPTRIAGMFDAIAPRYDLLNHLLSAGMDRGWRERAVDELALSPGARVLDLCTGTGDLALAIVRRATGVTVVGVDFAGEMLRLARSKILGASLERRIGLVRGDATRIPLPDNSCDGATIAFGIRNVAEPHRALEELARVMRPGARLAILEFGQPRIPGVRTMYSWYFRYVLPMVGRLVSKHQSAYSYLPASVGAFPPPAEFARVIAATGFSHVRAVPLTFGIVYLYVAQRAGA